MKYDPAEFAYVNQKALENPEVLLRHLLPGGYFDGSEYVVLNPTRPDSHLGSFKVNCSTLKWSDFATGDKGGDAISLVAYVNRSSQGVAKRWITDLLKLNPLSAPSVARAPRQSTSPPSDGVCLMPAPIEFQLPPHRTLPDVTFPYFDYDGKLLGKVVRWNQVGVKKLPLPVTCWDTGSGPTWVYKWWPAPRPLYGLDHLAKRPNAPVLIVEGEKTADAARLLFPDHVCITSPNGASGARHADWWPLFPYDAVTIWPDHHDTGRAYAESVATILREMGVRACIVSVLASWPDKWDLADPLPAGVDAPDLRRLLLEARLDTNLRLAS